MITSGAKAFRTGTPFLAAMFLAGIVSAQEIPPRSLAPMEKPQAAAGLFKPSDAQVTVQPADGGGVSVTIAPGKSQYPGITLKPQDDPVWDLSNYGHVEARITNTGEAPLRLNLRVDNPHDDAQKAAWNAEMLTLPPGQSGTIKTIFGYSYGFQPAFKLKPEIVNAVLLFAAPSDKPQSFKIETFAAAGPPNEKPKSNDNRIKPKNGILLGEGVNPSAKQLIAKNGVTAKSVDGGIALTYPANGGDSAYFTLTPPTGLWHLGDGNELRVTLKNNGSGPITPTIAVSGNGDSVKATGQPIAPGEQGEVIVPFAAPTRWQGLPAAERKPGHDTKPGTGTLYASDKTDGIKITLQNGAAAASLLVSSIRLGVATCELPAWVGQRPPTDGDWVQTFNDDFDGSSVDLTKWNNTGPNYWDKITHWSKDNSIVADGLLKIRFEKKTGFQNDDPKQKQNDFACGYLDTFEKLTQRYGYFETRLKLPTAPGLWPAFWMMPDRGPNQPGEKPGSKAIRCSTANGAMEFDIMEHLDIWGPYRFNIAMHWDNYGKDHKATGTGKIYVKPDKDGFITCGLLWLPGQAIYYCQGEEIGRWEDARVSNVPGYLMFTMPNGGWDGNVLDGSHLPDDLVVDYVRVWQRKDLVERK